MSEAVSVTTGSRIHFGLIGWGPEHPRQFGGVGVMIEPPSLQLRASAAPAFSAHGPLAERATAIVKRLVRHWQLNALPACRLEVVSASSEHAGLGTGTALALATASALAQFLRRGEASLEELALATGRGLRSAIGAHGFNNGGLIYEDGKAAGDVLGRLQARVTLPSEWRFVLVRTGGPPGLGGDDERRAFELVPTTPLKTSAELRRLAADVIVPAARAKDFQVFASAVADYNHLAGSCFASVQQGDYASAEIADLVGALRNRSVAGVGQSSWGPTVFAIVPDEAAAHELKDSLARERGYETDRVSIASATNGR
ncbi:MAG: hypothetical protein WD851_07915 [Pirellulales bacterium]